MRLRIIQPWKITQRLQPRKAIEIATPLAETQLDNRPSQARLVCSHPHSRNEPFQVSYRYRGRAQSIARSGEEETVIAWGRLLLRYRLNARKRSQIDRFIASDGLIRRLVQSHRPGHVWALDDRGDVRHWNVITHNVAEEYNTGLSNPSILSLSPKQDRLAVAAGRRIWVSRRRRQRKQRPDFQIVAY